MRAIKEIEQIKQNCTFKPDIICKEISIDKKDFGKNIPPMPMSARSNSVGNFQKKVPVQERLLS